MGAVVRDGEPVPYEGIIGAVVRDDTQVDPFAVPCVRLAPKVCVAHRPRHTLRLSLTPPLAADRLVALRNDYNTFVRICVVVF